MPKKYEKRNASVSTKQLQRSCLTVYAYEAVYAYLRDILYCIFMIKARFFVDKLR